MTLFKKCNFLRTLKFIESLHEHAARWSHADDSEITKSRNSFLENTKFKLQELPTTIKNHIHKEQTNTPSLAALYHIITAMSERRANRSALNSDIGRSGSTQNQDKSAITLFNNLIVDVLRLVYINDMKMDDLEDEVENILIGFSLYS